MPNFPTLSVPMSVEPYEEGVALDPTISSQTEGGYKQTRPRFTRIRDKWEIGYLHAPAADKILVRNFEKTVKVGSDSFSWTDLDSVSRTVRFLSPVKYKMATNKTLWDISFVLEEV